jgi:hypothetical protein
MASSLISTWSMHKPRLRGRRTRCWWIASGVRIRGWTQRCDLARDVLLERLNRFARPRSTAESQCTLTRRSFASCAVAEVSQTLLFGLDGQGFPYQSSVTA